MKIFRFLYILLGLIKLSFSLIPLWNLKNTSINLLLSSNQSKEIIIYSYESNNLNVILTKEIERNNSEIKDTNYITINDKKKLKTDFEDIDSSFFIENAGIFICPKGKHFLNAYNDEKFEEIKPKDFNSNNNNWELKCYRQLKEKNWMFQGFLNNYSIKNFFGKDFNHYPGPNKNDWKSLEIEEGLLDFLWTIETFNDNKKHNMFALTLKDQNILLTNLVVQIGPDLIISSKNDAYIIDYNSLYKFAYFDYNTNFFYWMVSNGTDQYRSGYSIDPIDIKGNNLDIQTIVNSFSPFLFLNDVEIKKLEMIRNTRFVIYEVSDKNNVIYRGIIDIELNQIIFNTNENFIKFQPLKNYTIFALTEKDAYEICLIKDNDNCIERCPSNKRFVLNNIEGNHCGPANCMNFLLIPNNICIDYCNITFYSFNKDKQCGLCKDIDPANPYKILNQEGCFSHIPSNTYIFNGKYNLLNMCPDNCSMCSSLDNCTECKKGFILENYQCIKDESCYKNCELCSENSEDENNQHCTLCKKDFYFYNENGEGNCLNKCPEGFYTNNANCSKCHENCKNCSNGPEIKNGTESQNCDTCKENWKYLIKGSQNCINECPKGTDISENKYCILSEKKDNHKDSIVFYIIIVLIILCLLVIIICIYRKIWIYDRRGNKIINEINKELVDDNYNLVDE